MQSHGYKNHIVRYSTYMLIFVWILLLGYLFYEYLVSKTDKAPTKGGTLIEGVTESISYIPYIGNSQQDKFYQNLLFKGCQSFFTSGSKVYYEPDLCDVITDDDKTYVVSIIGEPTWSDNAPVTIEDLIFSYKSVLQDNIWNLPHGKAFSSINIQKLSSNSLTITFPRQSQENMEFFTYPIMPRHILEGKSWEWYEENFAKSPIYNGCARLSNSRDENSLIFDVGGCPKNWMKFYQVKKISLEQIQEDPGIIDMYIGGAIIPGYKTGTVMTNDYVGLFFNMQRGKLSIYGRKNVIGLINKYIYLPENNVPIVKEHFLFENYPDGVTDKSTIRNVASGNNNPIRVIYYEKDPLYNHIINIMKNIMETEGLIDYFSFEGFSEPQAYIDALVAKDYDITLQTIALGTKKDISSMFLVDDPLANPSLYINPNLATQISEYFQSTLTMQYAIKPVIAKLYSTDVPFFIMGKSISTLNLKPSIDIDTSARFDIATVRRKILNNAVLVHKPQVTRNDILNRKRFATFILSELGL